MKIENLPRAFELHKRREQLKNEYKYALEYWDEFTTWKEDQEEIKNKIRGILNIAFMERDREIIKEIEEL